MTLKDKQLTAIFTRAAQDAAEREKTVKHEKEKNPTIEKIRSLVGVSFTKDPSFINYKEFEKGDTSQGKAGIWVQSAITRQFIQILDNENGTFWISTSSTDVSTSERAYLRSALDALGTFYGRFAKTVAPPQPRQEPRI